MSRRVVCLGIVVVVSLVARGAQGLPTRADGEPPLPEPAAEPAPEPEVIEISNAAAAAFASEDLTQVIAITGSPRGVAEDFLVLADGADVGARLRVITSDDGLGVGRLKLTDLALFDLHAQWGFARGFELDGALSVLAKQPSTTDEPVWQGASLAVRRDLWTRTAAAVSGSAAPLVGLDGVALGAAAFVSHKHRLNEIVAFALAAGANGMWLRPSMATDDPVLLEAAGHAAVHVGFARIWGGWLGAGYALPVIHRGRDPIGGMSLDPQPRLDLRLGNAVKLAEHWDLSVELTIVDRGDPTSPATRLPLLDGGFDQIQLSVGISRRIDLSNRSRHRRGVGDPMITL